MQMSASMKASRLPKRFPVGTTYVVEGRGGEHGQLHVVSRFVLLPGGKRINLACDFGPAVPCGRSGVRKPDRANAAKSRSERVKKIRERTGTS